MCEQLDQSRYMQIVTAGRRTRDLLIASPTSWPLSRHAALNGMRHRVKKTTWREMDAANAISSPSSSSSSSLNARLSVQTSRQTRYRCWDDVMRSGCTFI